MKNDVCILLATYNGEKYLEEQLMSLIKQKKVNIKILVRDDGSTDNTINILEKWQNRGYLEWFSGKHSTIADAFFELIQNAPDVGYYAFCDQDDVWDDDKLNIAIKKINHYSASENTVYCCGSRLVDERLNYICNHRMDLRRTKYARMFYAGVAGNTVVFNKNFRDVLKSYHPRYMIMHDSYCFKLAICLGANIIIDPNPHLSYRQHGNNSIGMQLTLKNKIDKFKYIVFDKEIRMQLKEIRFHYNNEICEEFKGLIDMMLGCRKSIKCRLKIALNNNIDFNNFFYNLAFKIKAITDSF